MICEICKTDIKDSPICFNCGWKAPPVMKKCEQCNSDMPLNEICCENCGWVERCPACGNPLTYDCFDEIHCNSCDYPDNSQCWHNLNKNNEGKDDMTTFEKLQIQKVMLEYSFEAVQLASDFNLNLDFEEPSILIVSQFLNCLHESYISNEMNDQQMTAYAQLFGAYAGQLIIEHLGGFWTKSGPSNGFEYCIMFGDDESSNYIFILNKALKQIANGESDSISGYYTMIKNGLLFTEGNG